MNRHLLCPSCGYDLVAIERTRRCPECGCTITDARTEKSRRSNRNVKLLYCASVIMVFGTRLLSDIAHGSYRTVVAIQLSLAAACMLLASIGLAGIIMSSEKRRSVLWWLAFGLACGGIIYLLPSL